MFTFAFAVPTATRVPSVPVACMAVLTCLAFARPARADERPNVLVILADDQGWGDVSCSGNSNLATPNIDSLAAAGVTFDRFFVCPVCAPTRAEFLTGRYHPRGGVRGVTTGSERLDIDEKTIADDFRAAGYATGVFGKWHNGTQYPYHPNARGFDEFYGFASGHWGNYFDPLLEHNGALVRGSGYITDDLTDHAMRFIEQRKDRPFFCYVAYNTPHSPMQVPDRFYRKFTAFDPPLRASPDDKEEVGHTRAALAMCENIDWNVGRLLERLDDLDLDEKTIVVYFSDNGPNGWRWNGGMKGIKGHTDEGGVRSPFFMRWPGHIPAGKRIEQIAGAIDLLPTLVDLAGIARVGDKPLDGISLRPLLSHEAAPADWSSRMIFSHWAGKVSVRTQQYRQDHAGRLFDMQADPGQQRDVSRERPEVARRLSEAVDEWKARFLTDLGDDDRPYPVGYPQFPVTWLPARDGVPHGNVERSARAPNCSYFTNFASKHDSITWDIEVATAGAYEVDVYYTCRPADVGATVELSFNGERIEAMVRDSHDPPARGAEHDRFPRRGESLVKDFKPLRLGVMSLSGGRGLLTLRPLKIPGAQAMEVRMLRLALSR